MRGLLPRGVSRSASAADAFSFPSLFLLSRRRMHRHTSRHLTPPPSPPSVDAFTSINPRLLSGWRALREGSAHHRGSIEIYRRYLRAIHAHGSDAEAFAIDSRCSGIPEADIAHVIRVIPLTDPREKSRRFSPRVLSLCRPSVLWLALSFLRADS
jgi:hypothetical protein